MGYEQTDMSFSFSDLEAFKAEVGAPFGHSEEMPPGSGITLTEAKTMYALVRLFGIRKVLEAGTNMGNSTWYLAEALKKNHGGSFEGHYLTTIDVQQLPNRHTLINPNVLAVQSDALAWMRANDLSQFDYFNHDDDHQKVHIEAEMALIYPHKPKVITIHDSFAESKDFWQMVIDSPVYMPEYERHLLRSVLGIGILIRK